MEISTVMAISSNGILIYFGSRPGIIYEVLGGTNGFLNFSRIH